MQADDSPDKFKKVRRENLEVHSAPAKAGFLLGEKADQEAEKELKRREEALKQEEERAEKAGLPGLPNPNDMVSYLEAAKAKKEGKPVPGADEDD